MICTRDHQELVNISSNSARGHRDERPASQHATFRPCCHTICHQEDCQTIAMKVTCGPSSDDCRGSRDDPGDWGCLASGDCRHCTTTCTSASLHCNAVRWLRALKLIQLLAAHLSNYWQSHCQQTANPCQQGLTNGMGWPSCEGKADNPSNFGVHPSHQALPNESAPFAWHEVSPRHQRY